MSVDSAGSVGWIQIALSSAASPLLCTGPVSTVGQTPTVAETLWVTLKTGTDSATRAPARISVRKAYRMSLLPCQVLETVEYGEQRAPSVQAPRGAAPWPPRSG